MRTHHDRGPADLSVAGHGRHGDAGRRRRERQQGRQGTLSAHRLSGGIGAPGHHLDGVAAPAELRPAARALRAVGGWHAARLDRDHCWAAASRWLPPCRRPIRASACSFASTCRRMPTSATKTLTVKARGRGQQYHPAAHHQPRQGVAGEADDDAAIAVAARHPEIELRLYARDQERQRPQSHREPCRDRAAQFRDLVHRGLWHPGTVLGADRCRRLQGREAQGAAAVLGRCRQLPDRGDGERRPTRPP